jgi:hypothetical protein
VYNKKSCEPDSGEYVSHYCFGNGTYAVDYFNEDGSTCCMRTREGREEKGEEGKRKRRKEEVSINFFLALGNRTEHNLYNVSDGCATGYKDSCQNSFPLYDKVFLPPPRPPPPPPLFLPPLHLSSPLPSLPFPSLPFLRFLIHFTGI